MMRLLPTIMISLATCVGGNYLYSRYVQEEPSVAEKLRERFTSYALDKVRIPDLERYVRQQFQRKDFRVVEEVVKLDKAVREAYCSQKTHAKYRRELRCP